jgi:integrative and conjugative element protein (TIGR02256 family)
VDRTAGQVLAVEQLAAIAAASDGALQLGQMTEPAAEDPRLAIEVSIDCSRIEPRPGGIRLRGRERLRLRVPAGFPFRQPVVSSCHRRWRGTAHVQWGSQLCLYQAAGEWDPQAGMYGLLVRIELWLTRAAAGELDPDDAPLHPPVQYGGGGAHVIVHADAPAVDDTPWLGFAQLVVRGERRIDVVGWSPDPVSGPAALAILLTRPFAWEYPGRVSGLYSAFADQGIAPELLDRALMLGSHSRPQGAAQHVVVGTPMRRGHDGRPRQHLAVWEIEPDAADLLHASLARDGDDAGLSATRAELRTIVRTWADSAPIIWCPVSENRPEIVIRRDDRSPVHEAFAGTHVVVWGCGAIGAPVAEWIARAGARKLSLYDDDVVTPGVLVRQPYLDADTGHGKARVLAARLKQINPALEVEHAFRDVISGPLSRADWHDHADILIDATASAAVRLKLESVRRTHAAPATTLVTMLFGHDAERGLAVVAPPSHSGGPEDVLRQLKLACCGDANLAGFADEFWPHEPRTDHFQPEPGCSDTTFRGSGVEAGALAAGLLHAVAATIARGSAAAGHLQALPTVAHAGRRQAEIAVTAAAILPDGVRDYELRLSATALADIRGWMARNDRALDPASETGGVLFGRRDEATGIVWIDSVTGPPPDSVATPGGFDCGVDGVPEATAERISRSRGELAYVGMWHTHPGMDAHASLKDLAGMLGLVASQEAREAVMLIVGGRHGHEELAGYVFNGDQIRDGAHRIQVTVNGRPTAAPALAAPAFRDLGLALSGGGSRALAFHLGCLRALHDRGVLDRVRVVSGVSGGALMSALYAYRDDDFDAFDARVVELLRRGLHGRIARRALLSRRLVEGVATRAFAGSASALSVAAAKLTGAAREGAPLRRWVSRTDAFEDVLRSVLGDIDLDSARCQTGMDVVISACDLRTGSAFRFGSKESASSHLGRLTHQPAVATAVAASAAYPLYLPALDRSWEFERRDGTRERRRVVLTDGGVYDNSGLSALRPSRSDAHSYNVFDLEYVIVCDAGRGQLRPKVPFQIAARTNRAFEASFRKLQDAARNDLHEDLAGGKLKGFIMPYLGQRDDRLPWTPPDLVRRERVVDYPTNFAAMDAGPLALLTTRGEQLTRLLIERWCPDL